MSKKQTAGMSQITLIGAGKPSKATKLTKMDRLAVAAMIVFDRDDLATDLATDIAEEMHESRLFIESARKALTEIESAGNQEGKEIALVSYLANLRVATRIDVTC